MHLASQRLSRQCNKEDPKKFITFMSLLLLVSCPKLPFDPKAIEHTQQYFQSCKAINDSTKPAKRKTLHVNFHASQNEARERRTKEKLLVAPSDVDRCTWSIKFYKFRMKFTIFNGWYLLHLYVSGATNNFFIGLDNPSSNKTPASTHPYNICHKFLPSIFFFFSLFSKLMHFFPKGI